MTEHEHDVVDALFALLEGGDNTTMVHRSYVTEKVKLFMWAEHPEVYLDERRRALYDARKAARR